jgi:hypothetical protein
MKNSALLALITWLISGCSSMNASIDSNTYIAMSGSMYGAITLANRTCAQQGKIARVTNMSGDEWNEYQIIFNCLGPIESNDNKIFESQNQKI